MFNQDSSVSLRGSDPFQFHPKRREEEEMVGPARPLFVLFGSSLVQLSYSQQGWGAILSHLYARKVCVHVPFTMVLSVWE